MTNLVIKSGQVITPFKVIEEGVVVVEDGKIVAVGSKEIDQPKDAEFVNAKGLNVAPGFIDVHIHGSGGASCRASKYEEINKVSTFLAKYGTTGFFPTVSGLSDIGLLSYDAIKKAVKKGTHGAQILGIHDESVYKNPKKLGAASPHILRKPDVGEFNEIVDKAEGWLRLVTLAPELEGGIELIKYLTKKNIVSSVGHSYATYDEMCEAIDAGLSHACHTYNGMRELHHREPGVVGAVLSRNEIMAELIADNIHVGVPAMRILIRCKGTDNTVLITDAGELAGLPDGEYSPPRLKGHQRAKSLIVKDFKVFYRSPTISSTMPEDVQIAGSASTMIRNVGIIVNLVGIPLKEAIKMASTNPAREFQLNEKGSLTPGKDADIILFDNDFQVKQAIVKGKTVYKE